LLKAESKQMNKQLGRDFKDFFIKGDFKIFSNSAFFTANTPPRVSRGLWGKKIGVVRKHLLCQSLLFEELLLAK